MNRGFFKNLMDKGKALIEKAKPSFMKSPGEITDLCEGLVKLPNQTDSIKLKESNPYFTASSTKPQTSLMPESLPSVIILVVGFHHKKGSVIEYAYPETAQKCFQTVPYEELSKKICFVAIPDAVHALEEQVWFGVSCFRQIESSLLAKVEAQTRAYVQKAVCIISRTPLFAFMLNKLHPTTHAYFNQVNFEDRKILYDLYVNITTVSNANIEYASLFTGFPLRQLISFLKENVLTLLKLIIMERKVVIYSHKASIVSGFILSMCSLVPGLLGFGGEQLSSKKVNAYLKSEEMYGLPLHIYNNKTYLIPLFTLNDLDLLADLNGYTIGTTNMLVLQLPQVKADAYINIDLQTFTLENKSLEAALKPTSYEHAFIKKLLNTVGKGEYDETAWSCLENPMEEGIEHFAGSNDFIRKKFGKYFHKLMVNLSVAEFICGDFEPTKKDETEATNLKKLKKLYDGLQSSAKHTLENEVTKHEEKKNIPETVMTDSYAMIQEDDKEERKAEIPRTEKERIIRQVLQGYNLKFIKEWQFTINYRMWQLIHSSKLFAFSDFINIPVTTTVYYENGDVYIGEIVQGKKSGTGTLSYEGGNSIYEGEWANDKRNGKGHQVTKEGKYSGNFSDDVFHGSGVYCESDGAVYDGDWVQGQKSGMAHIKYANGETYVGEYKYGKKHGKGQYTFKNGEVYSGEFMNDMKHGVGHLIKEGGVISAGTWVEDKYAGSGAQFEKILTSDWDFIN